MRFLLFVEGDTEKEAIGKFLAQWLNKQLVQRVGVSVHKFKGVGDFRRGIAKRAARFLQDDKRGEIIAAIGLVDLYGGLDFPRGVDSRDERYAWGVRHFEKEVDSPKFRMFFAVHETEAWLLSSPEVFPGQVAAKLPALAARPEEVNFDNPPSKRIEHAYGSGLSRTYKKTTHGKLLFSKLDPDVVYGKCPYFARMMDSLLELAKQAGC